MIVNETQAKRKGPGGDVVIPIADSGLEFWLNFTLRLMTELIYAFFLAWTCYNIWHYLILKQRYKEFAIILYYTFFVALFTSRVIQTGYQFEYLNNPQVKNCIVAADGFSVAIGLTQLALIGDLIISLQTFEQQAQVCDRDTMTQSSENPTARYAAIDKRTAFKRNALIILIALLITSVLMEIIIRIFVGYEYPLIILYSELVVIGASLAFETFTFLRLSRRIFGDDFKDE